MADDDVGSILDRDYSEPQIRDPLSDYRDMPNPEAAFYAHEPGVIDKALGAIGIGNTPARQYTPWGRALGNTLRGQSIANFAYNLAGAQERAKAGPEEPDIGGTASTLMSTPATGALQGLTGNVARGTQGAFISRLGRERLEGSSLGYHPDDPGGTARLTAMEAKPGWKNLRDPEEMADYFAQSGWSPPKTFGAHGVNTLKAKPMTWLEMPEAEVNQAALRPGILTPNRLRGAGSLEDMMQGIDPLLVAEPLLRKVQTSFKIDPARHEGQTVLAPYRAGQVLRGPPNMIPTPDEWRPIRFEATAPDLPRLEGLARHEILGHGTMAPQGVAFPLTELNPKMAAIKGSEAEQIYANLANEAALKWRDLVNIYGDRSPEAQRALEVRNRFRSLHANAPRNVGYLHDAQEQGARATDFLDKTTLDEMMKTRELAPSLLDTYQEGLMPSSWGGQGNFPFSAFRAPRRQP